MSTGLRELTHSPSSLHLLGFTHVHRGRDRDQVQDSVHRLYLKIGLFTPF